MVFKSEPLDIRTPFAAASLAQKQVGMAEELANGSSKYRTICGSASKQSAALTM
jgi:hypothetical protein